MSGEEVLLTLGEVAIAIAGFSSIVAVVGRRSERRWSPVESFRMAALISNAVAPALLAFLPFVLENLGLSQPTVWASSSAVLLAFVVAEVLWVVSRGPTAFREAGEPVRLRLIVAVNLCAFAAAVLQILNMFGLWFAQELGPYLAGLLLLLSIAVIQFCVLIFSPAYGEAPAVSARHEADE